MGKFTKLETGAGMKKYFFRNQTVGKDGTRSQESVAHANLCRDRHVIWVSIDGFHARLELKAQARADSSESELISPMTAKVLDVKARANQTVQAGEPVVVLSAMKMEYVLKSPIQGRISRIHCQVGDLVEQGQVLVRFE